MAILPLAVLLLTLRTTIANDALACYFRDGNFAQGYVQCPGPNGTKTAACCYSSGAWPHVDPCFSNGFCFSSDVGAVYRGACTDSDWNNAECVQSCPKVNTVGTAMLSFCQDGDLCCTAIDDSNLNNCCTDGVQGVNKFSWDDATFTGNLNASTLYDVYDSRQAIAGAVTNSTSNDATATTDSNLPTIDSSTPTTEPAMSTSNGAVSTDQTDSPTVSQSTVIGVGVGLGVPLLISLATCLWLFFALKKEQVNSRNVRGTYTPPQHDHQATAMSPQIGYAGEYAYAQSPSQHALSQSTYGYPSDAKSQNSMSPPPPPPPPPAELSDERAPVEAHS